MCFSNKSDTMEASNILHTYILQTLLSYPKKGGRDPEYMYNI